MTGLNSLQYWLHYRPYHCLQLLAICRCGLLIVCLLLTGGFAEAEAKAEEAPSGELRIQQVNQLIAQLDAETLAAREAAAKELVALAGKTERRAEQLLAMLPLSKANMPPAIRTSLESVRTQVELQLSNVSTQGSQVTLEAVDMSLADALKAIEEQSGNRIRDNRNNFGQEIDDLRINLSAKESLFWPTFDSILDQTKLDVYAYGGQGEMALINRTEGLRPRSEGVSYVGPFRFEPLRVVSTRGLRDTNESAIDLHIEISWEPKLGPIVLSQEIDELEVIDDGGIPVLPITDQESIDIEVVPGSQAIDLVLPLELSLLMADAIESVKGTLNALIPGKRHTFQFEQIAGAIEKQQATKGDTTVTFERFFKNNAIWELQMRLEISNAGEALASHRGWVFDNPSYLLTPEGKRIDHVGLETTMQSDTEVGLAFLFDLDSPSESEDGMADQDASKEAPSEDKPSTEKPLNGKPLEAKIDPATLKWIYVSPTGVINMPVEYELKQIRLP